MSYIYGLSELILVRNTVAKGEIEGVDKSHVYLFDFLIAIVERADRTAPSGVSSEGAGECRHEREERVFRDGSRGLVCKLCERVWEL